MAIVTFVPHFNLGGGRVLYLTAFLIKLFWRVSGVAKYQKVPQVLPISKGF